MAPGVGSSELETPAEALADARLQGAVIGGSGGPVQDRVAGVAQIRYAQVGVAALVSSDAFGRDNVEAVGRYLAVDRARGSGDAGLVERNGQHLIAAVVADVAQAEEPRIKSLVLQIETPVGGVREAIVGVVAAEDVGRGASDRSEEHTSEL